MYCALGFQVVGVILLYWFGLAWICVRCQVSRGMEQFILINGLLL
jgi:hypothetical protein